MITFFLPLLLQYGVLAPSSLVVFWFLGREGKRNFECFVFVFVLQRGFVGKLEGGFFGLWVVGWVGGWVGRWVGAGRAGWVVGG
jgi:hypothetical protein